MANEQFTETRKAKKPASKITEVKNKEAEEKKNKKTYIVSTQIFYDRDKDTKFKK